VPQAATASPRRKKKLPTQPGEIIHLGPFDVPHVGQREVRVFLPPGYHGGTQSHPLLLMWDGQNVFGDAGSFAGGWHVDQSVSKRAAKKKTAPVVVGIHHGGAVRLQELSPWSPMGASLAEPLLEWVCNTLVPALYKQFRLNPRPGGVTVAGSSLGGLMALWSHFRRPDVFGNALVMSPSLFLGRGAIFDFVTSQSKPWHTKVYLDAGGKEAGGRLLRSTQRMADLLKARGWQPHELLYRPVKSGQHNERHWARRIPRALRFLYG